MKMPTSTRMRALALMLILVLATLTLYTSLHEAGHALAGLAFGGRVTDFSIDFIGLSAHAGLDGDFSPAQSAVINSVGTGLPLLAWAVLMLALPRRGSFTVQWTKIVATLMTLNTLLAWIALPLFYLAGSAPPFDDVTQFILHSGFPALAVALGALVLYSLGWVLFALRIGSLRASIQLLRSADAQLPAWKNILAAALGLVVFWAAVMLMGAALRRDFSALPPGYSLSATIPLDGQDHRSETVYAFSLDGPAEVGILLRVESLNTPFLDVSLHPAVGQAVQLLHGEQFMTDLSIYEMKFTLPAGEHRIVLTSRASPGILDIYLLQP